MTKTRNMEFLSQNAIWVVLIVLGVIMSIAQPSFLSGANLLTLLSGEAWHYGLRHDVRHSVQGH